MEEGIKFFVGLDVHKDSIAIAVAEAGRAPARSIGSLPHDVGKLLKRLAGYGEARHVHVVYQAGPTGYGLQRLLAQHGYACQVIAPSLNPRRSGDRVKTDTEAAWNYRFTPRIGYAAWRRAEHLPQAIRDTAWKAQLRLCARFARLRARGVHVNKACVAVARELAGFI